MYLSVGKSLCVVHGGGAGRLFNTFILGVGALMRRGRFLKLSAIRAFMVNLWKNGSLQ